MHLAPVVWWAGAITACAIKPDTNLLQILQVLTEKLDQPFSISYVGVVHSQSPMCVGLIYIPRRKIIIWLSKPLPSASVTGTSGTPRISF